jgi:hypothetical protein
MHGSKKFIVVGDAYEYARWYDRLGADLARRAGGARLKRSRHRTSVDTYLVRETEIKRIGRRFGRAPAPKYWRKVLNRRYRARMQNLLRHERYEDLYPPPRDGSWFW